MSVPRINPNQNPPVTGSGREDVLSVPDHNEAPEVPRLLSYLSNRLETLSAVSSDLETSLAPILIAVPDNSDPALTMDANTPVGQRLSEMCARVAEISDRLSNIIQRAEV